jgi:hypothetical protein
MPFEIGTIWLILSNKSITLCPTLRMIQNLVLGEGLGQKFVRKFVFNKVLYIQAPY